MATTITSAWKKPGSWALAADEEHEAELLQEKEKESEPTNYTIPHHQQQQQQPLSEYPSLTAAVATKTKKKKPQPVSLAEFNSGKSVSHGSAKSGPVQIGLTVDELSVLPTGPRERSAEELERQPRGFRFDDRRSSNGSGRDGRDGERRERREREPLGPSRADEIDDWGAGKKTGTGMGSGGFGDRGDRRERGSGVGGFFENSGSRADESDNWGSKKSFVASEPVRRNRYEGLNNGGSGGADSESWGRKKEEGGVGDGDSWGGRKREEGGVRREKYEGLNNGGGGGADGETWGKRGEEGVANGGGVGGRPRLVLQPRTVPVSEEQRPGSGSGSRKGTSAGAGSGSNPFGEARPREEVLKEKGEDWRKIDEKLEGVKIKEIASSEDRPGSGSGSRSRGSGVNPFGEARPREEVLKQKGQDWKKTDEKFEVARVAPPLSESSSLGRKSFGSPNGPISSTEDPTERSWKKAVLANVSTPSVEKTVENGGVAADGVTENGGDEN